MEIEAKGTNSKVMNVLNFTMKHFFMKKMKVVKKNNYFFKKFMMSMVISMLLGL